jgi:hypothetical protein
VFFTVYAGGGDLDNARLATSARLDRKGFNTSIPGNCLQCHGINSQAQLYPDRSEVRRAYFLPFDLDSFSFFSDDPSSELSRSRQEAAFRAQNRMVRDRSRLHLADNTIARELIDGWYGGDLVKGTFDGSFIPGGWSDGDPNRVTPQEQLYLQVYARTCRTCHISYEQVTDPGSIGDRQQDLQFGTHPEFELRAGRQACPPDYNKAYRQFKPMPNAEQTLKIFWSTSARAHLFAQVQTPGALAFGDCAPPAP